MNNNRAQQRDRHFLIAVDGSEGSKRAVVYVADMLGGLPGFAVTLLSVVPEPDEDFFDSEDAQIAWLKEQMADANRRLNTFRQVLVQAGFPEEKVRTRACVGGEHSFAEAILETKCELSCCTIVVGRQHKSRTEEFLLGSTSTRLIRGAKGCAVWVVE